MHVPDYRRFLGPTLADVLAVILALWLVHVGTGGFFADPGTLWHIQTGQIIVDSGAVPRADSYSYTHFGQPWVETQWGADVLLYGLYSVGGYTLIMIATVALLVGLFRWVYRTHVDAGGWPAVGMIVTLLAALAASGHFLARPLLATTIGVPLCYWWASQYARGKLASRRVWWLVPVAIVGCNLHPGMLGGIVTVGLVGTILTAQGLFLRESLRRREHIRRGIVLIAVGIGMGIGSLINPYGIAWHGWVTRLMGSAVLGQHIQEWQAPAWGDVDTRVTVLLLVLAATGVVVRRRGVSLAEAGVLLFWLFEASRSYRHMPLVVIMLALQMARIFGDSTRTWRPPKLLAERLPLFSPAIRDRERNTPGGAVSVGLVIVLTGLCLAGVRLPALGLGTAGPPTERYSMGSIAHLRHHPPAGRVFNDINFCGLLIRELPSVPVFIDDRYGLHGVAFVERYIEVMRDPQCGAAELFDEYRIDTVIVQSAAPLCGWLAERSGWRQTYRDQVATVFRRDYDEGVSS